ncbi:hypothetical protein GCM10027271_30760 [Saccharopolyspora gloriosae]|uniref:DUF397 domain-containing protein n=1 Tax=Saccharopolyspora gloriosae TaxID=455344 RepID=A0A840NJ12_9PSEU|nr:DUF397 domain-containing protein [Saccharopolyspora gloriosae]MBB5070025.1 hypothetical protein [Saccharopolyspora gloriosae]
MSSSNTPVWRKSSRSGGAQQCVEVATNVPGTALIRDSKLCEHSPIIGVGSTTFAVFLDAVKADRFQG